MQPSPQRTWDRTAARAIRNRVFSRRPGWWRALPLPLLLLATPALPSETGKAPIPNQDIADLLDHAHYAEAEAMARERLPQVEARYGPDHPETAHLLDLLVQSLWQQAKVKDGEARRLAERAIRISETNPETRPEDLSKSLSNMAQVLAGTDDLPGAKALLERALTLRESALGPDHPEVNKIIVNLGIVAGKMGDYPTARAQFEKALAIARRTLAAGDPVLGYSLVNLGTVDNLLGDYEAAQKLYEEAIPLWEAAYGPDHPNLAGALIGLANARYALGGYSGALPIYPRTIAMVRKSLGPDHPSVANQLTSYAEVLRATGQLDEARRNLEEALAIQRKALGPESPQPANTLRNIAAVRYTARDYSGAREPLEQANALIEKVLGPDHPELVSGLKSLAQLHAMLGETERAAATLDRARALAEKHFPPDHPYRADMDAIDSMLRLMRGDLPGALTMTERALSVRLARMGPSHQLVLEARSRRARILWDLGEREAALVEAQAAAAALDRMLRDTMRVLPEERALQLSAARVHPESVLFAGLVADTDRREPWLAACWSWVLANRGLVLEEISARRVIASLAETPEARSAQDRLRRASNRLAAVWTQGGSEKSAPKDFSGDLEAARRELDAAESALAEASARFRHLKAFAPAGAAEVARALPEGSVLIEVTRVDTRPTAGETDEGEVHGSAMHYVALSMDRKGRAGFADLGEAGVIETMVDRWRAALDRGLGADSPGAAREMETTSRALGRDVWGPLARLAGDARRVFLVPDGALHQVYFPALVLADGRFEIEQGPTVHILSTGRDLARRRDTAGAVGAGDSLLALGGVAFARTGRPMVMRGNASCRSPLDADWPALPESRREVARVATLFKGRGPALALTGADASESRFKRDAPGRRVLHLSTHGYFLGENCGGTAPNPLLLSGLVLAPAAGAGGAEDGAAGAHGSGGGDDGILTAEELSALDLSDAGLAVLSACNSGLGPVTSGEGVFGLRRALEIAGARSVVMSLWPVPDREAMRWMRSFYTGWLAGRPVDDAARRASLDLLADLRRREAAPHPYLFGGFVTTGDWSM